MLRSEILAHIATSLTSTPASLGDPKKDTPEELEERHERVLTASLYAAAALLTTMHQAATQQQHPPQQSSSEEASGTSSSTSNAGTGPAAAAAGPGAAATAAALQEVQDRVSDMMAAPGFFKQKLGSKSPVVQRAAYGFIQAVCSCAPQLLQPLLPTAAPVVLGALQVCQGMQSVTFQLGGSHLC
jgi:hypothetical protein